MHLRYFSETGWLIQDHSPETAEDKHGNTCYRGDLVETRSEFGYYYATQNGGESGLYWNILTNEMEQYQ
jgi:hypothetical protein